MSLKDTEKSVLQLIMNNFPYKYSLRLPPVLGIGLIQNQTSHHFITLNLIAKILFCQTIKMHLPRARAGITAPILAWQIKLILQKFKGFNLSLTLMGVNTNSNRGLELNYWPAFSAAKLQPCDGCSQQKYSLK